MASRRRRRFLKSFFIKYAWRTAFFTVSGVILVMCTDEDIAAFWDFFYNSRLYKFFVDIFFTSHEVDSSANYNDPAKKEEDSEKKSEESTDKEQKSKTANKSLKPETATIIKGGLIVGAIIGVATLIYKIFFKNGK